MNTSLKCFALFCCSSFMSSLLFGQIPNAGFESWSTTTQPDQWHTNNVLALTPVTQSNDSHSGSFALSGQVVNYFSTPYVPTANAGTNATGFPVSQKYSQLKGYFKYTPNTLDQFEITVQMGQAGGTIGGGNFSTYTTVSSYQQISVDIEYLNGTGIPDTGYIKFYIAGDTTGSNPPHIGSVFLVDDLSFGAPTGVTEPHTLPASFRLEQNFPNPFNPGTLIKYSLPRQEFVRLSIMNTLGQEIALPVHGEQQAGNYSVRWNALGYPSGLYFYRIATKDFVETKKMVFIK